MGKGTFVASRLANLPQPIAGPNGRVGATALGSAQDDELAMLSLVGKLRAPPRVDVTAIDDVGAGFAIPRYVGQTDADYQAAVVDAWPTWAESGSPQAIIDQLHDFGLVDVHTLREAGDGPIYNGEWYSRGRIVLGPDFGTTGIGPSLLGTSTTLGGFLLGTTATEAQRSTIKSIVWKWKASHGVVPDIGVVFDAPILGVTTYLTASPECTMASGGWTVPAVNAQVSVSVTPIGSLLVGQVVYLAEAGYYQVISLGSTHSGYQTIAVENLGTYNGHTNEAAGATINGIAVNVVTTPTFNATPLGTYPSQETDFDIMPIFGVNTYLSSCPLGGVDLT